MSAKVLSRLRQPEYTGENRCLPCTAANTAIAVALSAVVAAVAVAATTPPVGAAAGAGAFCLSGAAIYLRGYLVPGTPRLTRRYVPPWLLERFGKAETGHAEDRGSSSADYRGFDPERELTAVGALEECRDGADLCLTDEFRADWEGAVDRVREADAGRAELLAVLDADEGEVGYETHGEAFRALVDDRVVGRWESRAAFLADLGAARVLERRHPDWDGLRLRERSRLLSGLRLFIDTCPSCGATPEFGADTVESCCSTRQVAAVSCTGCGARLFESDPIQ
jgi:hypothetical protein